MAGMSGSGLRMLRKFAGLHAGGTMAALVRRVAGRPAICRGVDGSCCSALHIPPFPTRLLVLWEIEFQRRKQKSNWLVLPAGNFLPMAAGAGRKNPRLHGKAYQGGRAPNSDRRARRPNIEPEELAAQRISADIGR